MIKSQSLLPEVVVAHRCQLGEGPVWDEERNTICWVDILAGAIHEFDTRSQQHREIKTGDMVGAIALTREGNYLAALKSGLALIDQQTGDSRPLFHPEQHIEGNRFNDGKCDSAGRFWIGSLSLKEEKGAGSLYMIDKNLGTDKKQDNLTISNGLCWSLDNKTFYLIDTPTGEVAAFDFNLLTGNITNKRTAVRIAKEDGSPDGMTIDAEGMLWIGHWDGWQVARYNPHTGEKLLQISLPVAQVTSCTFGGKDLQDLYITTASKELTAEDLEEQPLAGSLFVVRNCGFKGLPPVRFDTSGINE